MPIARQSGQWTRKAFVNGGRRQVRQALYLAALVAMRFDPDRNAKYQKLIVLANALVKKGVAWQDRMA